MNILVIGNFYTGAFGLHIAETLTDMNHSVFRFEPGLKYSKNSILGKRWNTVKQTLYGEVFSKLEFVHKRNTKTLYTIIKNNTIDLTIVLHDYLTPDNINQLKRITKSPAVLWFPDAISNFKKSMFLISDYDYLFFHDKYIVNELKTFLNINAMFLPQACYPKYHKKPVLSNKEREFYECDITNAGNMYPNRIALFEKLNDFNIKMWGNPPAIWAKNKSTSKMMQGKSVRHEEKAKAFHAAKIVLNNMHPAEINGINKRTFEAPACCGFMMINYKPAIDDLYIDGKEIVSYRSFDNMLEKINYYLSNDKEREIIAEAGMKRAHKDHSYEVRLKEMLTIIFG